MAWIDVKDRRPPQDTYVLVALWDDRPKVRMYFIRIASRIGDGYIDDKDGEILCRNYGEVTHWMPLPDKPEKSE